LADTTHHRNDDDDDDDAEDGVDGGKKEEGGTTNPSSSSALSRPQQMEKHRQEALAYINKYPGRVGLNGEMQVVRLIHGELQPVGKSNAEQLINYHFSPNRLSQKTPPGYQTFLRGAMGDKYIAARLSSTSGTSQKPTTRSRSQAASSSTKAEPKIEGKGRQWNEMWKHKKTIKKPQSKFLTFPFKPVLWI